MAGMISEANRRIKENQGGGRIAAVRGRNFEMNGGSASPPQQVESTAAQKFYAPVSKPAGASRPVQRGTAPISPTYSFSSKGKQAQGYGAGGQLDGMIKDMLSEKTLRQGLGHGDGRTRAERNQRYASRKIQAQNKVADMLSGLRGIGMQHKRDKRNAQI